VPDPKHEYLLANAAPATERERLRAIDELMAPITRRRLEALGLAPGWRCLEVGAGVGGVARWLAEHVGERGRVTAIDANPLLEADSDLPQLEVRTHDILEEGLEQASYDLVHCRLLLSNVGDPALALGRMTEALRPGGWLLVEEPGEGRMPAVGDTDPRVAEFNRLFEAFLNGVKARTGAVELDLFRRLPKLMREAGLEEIEGEMLHPLVGGPGRAALLGTLAAVRPLLEGTPFVTDGSLARLAELAADPDLLATAGATVALWGRRPGGVG